MSARCYTIAELLFSQCDADKYVDALLRERMAEKINARFLEEYREREREIMLGTGENEPRGVINWTGKEDARS